MNQTESCLPRKILVVSCFGRGHWLAANLAQKGHSVTLLDLSKEFKQWAPEDGSGPFGFFGEFPAELSTRWNADEAFLRASHGWTVLTQKGPFESKGPLSEYQRQFHQPPLWENNWLAALFNHWNSTRSYSLLDALDINQQISNDDFWFQRASRTGWQRNFEWLKTQNVEVLTSEKLVDAAFVGKKLLGLEISGEVNGLTSADEFIWCLTSQETQFISNNIRDKIFKQEVIYPKSCYMKFRIEWPVDVYLPEHFVMADGSEIPWQDDRFFIFQKTQSGNLWDVWFLIPLGSRFQKTLLDFIAESLCQQLEKRMAARPVKCLLPQEATLSFTELGPAVFPQYDNKVLLKPAMPNLILSSPETQTSFSLNVIFQEQQQHIKNLELKFAKEDKKKKKEVHP